MIEYQKLDITTIEKGFIAHGVNCQEVMGSGVALALLTKWPIVKQAYLDYFSNPNVEYPWLGTVLSVEVSETITVFNCFTQYNYGRNPKIKYANPTAIKLAIRTIFEHMISSEKTDNILYMPKIGCGLGGLSWEEEVKPILEELNSDSRYNDIKVVVCTL